MGQQLLKSKSSEGLAKQAPHLFVTVPLSHYCERARWALDLAGVHYTEDKWTPVLHWIGTYSASKGTYGSVPLFITNTGDKILDSGDIMQWVAQNHPEKAAHLYPQHLQEQVYKWETMFSKRLGPMTRVIAYNHLLQSPWSVLLPPVTWTVPAWRAALFKTLAYPAISTIRWGYRVNPASSKICSDKVRAIFAEVSGELSDGRPFLVAGSTAPTAADITFAALAAPLLNIPTYGGRLRIQLPRYDRPDWPGPELAATPAGKHAIRMYEMYRLPPDDTTTGQRTEAQAEAVSCL